MTLVQPAREKRERLSETQDYTALQYEPSG